MQKQYPREAIYRNLQICSQHSATVLKTKWWTIDEENTNRLRNETSPALSSSSSVAFANRGWVWKAPSVVLRNVCTLSLSWSGSGTLLVKSIMNLHKGKIKGWESPSKGCQKAMLLIKPWNTGYIYMSWTNLSKPMILAQPKLEQILPKSDIQSTNPTVEKEDVEWPVIRNWSKMTAGTEIWIATCMVIDSTWAVLLLESYFILWMCTDFLSMAWDTALSRSMYSSQHHS